MLSYLPRPLIRLCICDSYSSQWKEHRNRSARSQIKTADVWGRQIRLPLLCSEPHGLKWSRVQLFEVIEKSSSPLRFLVWLFPHKDRCSYRALRSGGQTGPANSCRQCTVLAPHTNVPILRFRSPDAELSTRSRCEGWCALNWWTRAHSYEVEDYCTESAWKLHPYARLEHFDTSVWSAHSIFFRLSSAWMQIGDRFRKQRALSSAPAFPYSS